MGQKKKKSLGGILKSVWAFTLSELEGVLKVCVSVILWTVGAWVIYVCAQILHDRLLADAGDVSDDLGQQLIGAIITYGTVVLIFLHTVKTILDTFKDVFGIKFLTFVRKIKNRNLLGVLI